MQERHACGLCATLPASLHLLAACCSPAFSFGPSKFKSLLDYWNTLQVLCRYIDKDSHLEGTELLMRLQKATWDEQIISATSTDKSHLIGKGALYEIYEYTKYPAPRIIPRWLPLYPKLSPVSRVHP